MDQVVVFAQAHRAMDTVRRAELQHLSTHGGKTGRQRALEELARHDAIDIVEEREWDSELAKSICVRWCWGYVSAIDVQRDAGLAHRDELALLRRLKKPENHASKCLKALAELGASGRQLGNCNRYILQ